MLHVDALMKVLPLALDGWFGVFLVTAVAIVSIYLLNWITSGKSKKD
ncbi:oxaloacetate decarboxylase [Oscillibacter sp. MSJ-2]|uniref:Oxaloacetate decarboxylase n=1 Tax=Dysosmobacter acutus TaxID=2841504 RepID=A0ABS6FAU3_9FIRM|nr:oxaloacetate decarboxylase [Dysosmobacter acutus]MBU5626771.1 oxaloacetate decarboxylase [Dysosmobacter acutus]